MQLAGDALLAKALDVGKKRYFGMRLMIDWARNGAYADPLSNMSAYVDELTIDRQLTGVVPAELQVTEGYSAAQCTITLSGSAADGTPLWKVFSPYSGYGTYGEGGSVNVPMYFQALVQSEDGSWTIDQFTGWIDSAKPDRASGTVSMICLDGGGQLEVAQTMDRWAVDAYRRESIVDQASANSNEALESGTISACWLIDSMLRRSGFYEGPNFHSQTQIGWTMRGSALPEIGSWCFIPKDAYENTWTYGMSAIATPNLTPAMLTPGEAYSKAAGKYGPAFKGQTLPNWKSTGQRYLKTMHGGANGRERVEVNFFGANNSHVIGFAGWIYVDTAQPVGLVSYSQYYLSSYHMNFSGSDSKPAFCFTSWNHKTGIANMQVMKEGHATEWNWSAPAMATGWHFVSWAVQFTPGQVRASCWIDGVQVINASNGGTVGGLGTLTYSWIEGTTNVAYVHAEGTNQYLQWVASRDIPLASYLQPASTPPPAARAQAKVDLSGQRLLWLPNIEQDKAGDVIQGLVGADLGAFYFTEQGVATFDSRATVKARQIAANAVFDVTLDNAMNLAPETTYASVANRIGYTATPKAAEPYSNIWASSKVDQFLIGPNSVRYFAVSLDNVMQIRAGDATWRPFAQGYDPGLPNPTQYWQNYMEYYKPDYWDHGWTSYLLGTRNPQNPPPPGPSASAAILPGWFSYDLNNRRARIVLGNYSTPNSLVFAVDDSAAFLKFAGTKIEDRPAVTESAVDATSVARYRERVFNFPADEWRQDLEWLRTLAGSLLQDVKNPQTQFEQVEVVGDPRRQLQDVCRIVDPDKPSAPGMTGATVAYGSVVGINRTFRRSGDGAVCVDRLTIRTFPG